MPRHQRWIAAEWLDRDPRLRASIVVPVHSAELAAEEIERCAEDKRFVQVLMLAQTELPLGRRQNWPIYRAAERHDLPIGIHAGSSFRHPPSALGWPSVLSRGLRLAGAGLRRRAEQPGHRRRIREVPSPEGRAHRVGRDLAAGLSVAHQQDLARRARGNAVARTAAIRDHPGACASDHPAVRRSRRAGQVETIIEEIGSDKMLLFSTDYPHWHFEGTNAVPEGLPDALVQKILIDNPLETYPRLS